VSVSHYGPSCEPAGLSDFGPLIIDRAEPTHDRCPGGSNTPGLIGGWDCPCSCHTSQLAPSYASVTGTDGNAQCEPDDRTPSQCHGCKGWGDYDPCPQCANTSRNVPSSDGDAT
jgi:hypothetical protein